MSRAPSYATSTAFSQSRKRFSSTWETFPLYAYSLDFELLRSGTQAEFQKLFGHYARHFGGIDSFLFSDDEDDGVLDHGFALGDGATTAFQLQRSLGGDVADASGNVYHPQFKPYTNLLNNSGFETDSNADGLADRWADYNNSSATEPNSHVIVPGMNGGKAQRISWGTNATNTKGVQQSGANGAPTPIAGQWYTVSCFARASGTNIGKFIAIPWNAPAPNQVVVIACPALSANWQRYVFQVFWNVGTVPVGGNFFSISNVATGLFTAPPTFGDLDFDLMQMTTGQWGLSDLMPVETPAAAAGTDNPAYYPSIGDGFEPVFDLNGPPTIYQDGDWPGRRQLFANARTNLINNSEQANLWTALNATVTADTSVAPDGTTTADTFNEGVAVTVQHRINTTGSAADIVGELRCWSVFVKAGTLPNINLSVPGAFSSAQVNFNLGIGVIDSTVGVLASGVITDPVRWPGWSRVWFVRRGSASGTALFVSGCLDNTYSSAGYTGTSRTFLIWGAQGEIVSNINGPTPYIKTPGAANVTVTDYSVSASGVVTLAAAPPAGSFLSWDGAYYRRVRFDVDSIQATRIVQTFWEARSIRLVSVKP